MLDSKSMSRLRKASRMWRDDGLYDLIVVTGYNFGCGSSREQSVTSILAKSLPLVVSGSVGNTFSRNAINNALPLFEIPRLVQRLREAFSNTKVQSSQQDTKETSENRVPLDSTSPAAQATPRQEKKLTRRTGWTFTWDVRFPKVNKYYNKIVK